MPWLLDTAPNVDVAGYIYEHYPKYRKIALRSVLFTHSGNELKTFQKMYNVNETFSFGELANIIGNTLEDPIVERFNDKFNENIIKFIIKPSQKLAKEYDESDEESDKQSEED